MLSHRHINHCLQISALGFMVLSGTAKADLVNGGFESTTLTASGQIFSSNVTGWSSGNSVHYNFIYFPDQASHPGVGAVDNDGSNAFVWLYGPTTGFPVSPNGGNFLAADADPNYNGAITQNVTGLVSGKTYDLSFYWGGAQYTTETGPTTESWKVSLDDQTQSTGFISNDSESFTGWQTANLLFTATDTSEVLTFLAVGTPNGAPPVALLDGVSLNQTPEPAYWTPLVLGLAALLFAAYRRRKPASTPSL